MLHISEIGKEKEMRLLEHARRAMGTLAFENIDVLVVRELGKDISGTGMDTNVIERLMIPREAEALSKANIATIAVLDLTEETHGNASGMGLANVTTLRVFEKIDWHVTYTNALTAGIFGMQRDSLPIVMPDDRMAIQAAVRGCGRKPETVRMVLIDNTLRTDHMWISPSMRSDAEQNPRIAILNEIPLAFTPAGTLKSPWRMAEAHEMKGAELASMMKSSIRFKSSDGVVEPGLRLTDEQIGWWQDLKFGLFIHWGLYSEAGRGEWLMFNEQIPAAEYAKLAEQFNPQKFDAPEWARIAKDAGMQYSVMVARHHDGFALWDSPSSHLGFTSLHSAAKRDFVKEYAEAFQAAGFHTGLYYSLMDWRFPGYFQPHELPESALEMKAQCYGQIEELMSRYGKIEVLWYDGGWIAHQGTDAGGAWLWEPGKLNQMVRRLQPGIVINERSGWEGDFETDEGPHAVYGPIMPIRWEKGFPLQHTWCYNKDGYVMPFEEVLSLLVNSWVRGGNVILNVGPDGDGAIPADQADVLAKIGAFLRENGEAVYATRPGPFQAVDGVYGATCRGSSVYLHVLDAQALAATTLPNLPQKIAACQTLQGQPVPFVQDEQGIRIRIPAQLCRPVDTVLRLELA